MSEGAPTIRFECVIEDRWAEVRGGPPPFPCPGEPHDLLIGIGGLEGAAGAPQEVRFAAQWPEETRLVLRSGYYDLELLCEGRAEAREFFAAHLLELVDLLVSALLDQLREDYLWFEADGRGGLWILAACLDGGVYRAVLQHRRDVDPTGLRRRFSDLATFPEDDGGRREFLRYAFAFLAAGLGLPPSVPFLRADGGRFRRDRLTVRAAGEPRWALLLPLDHFRRGTGFGGFAAYDAISWVVTGKQLTRHALEHGLIRAELEAPEVFLQHAVVVINEYEHFFRSPSGPLVEAGIRLLREVLGLFENLPAPGGRGRLRLRHCLNPVAQEVMSLLRHRDTWYFFADFHVPKGRWQVGGRSGTADEIPLDTLTRRELQHIRLMRVSHCDSLDPLALGDRPSIADCLLDAGVARVEGSPMAEDVADYVCGMLRLLCADPYLGWIGRLGAFQDGIEISALYRRADEFLCQCGWSPIAPS